MSTGTSKYELRDGRKTRSNTTEEKKAASGKHITETNETEAETRDVAQTEEAVEGAVCTLATRAEITLQEKRAGKLALYNMRAPGPILVI